MDDALKHDLTKLMRLFDIHNGLPVIDVYNSDGRYFGLLSSDVSHLLYKIIEEYNLELSDDDTEEGDS